MTIWLLALLLLASVAALGFRQGAIRVGVSFFGIFVGVLLAPMLGRFVRPILSAVGVDHPVLLWVLGPLIAFIVISALFKVGAAALHQKVDVYYKYKAGDLRLALWERLNHRLGACLGLLNGTAYLIIIAWVIYAFSYWSVQLSSGPEDPRTMRLLTRLGKDLHASGFAKVAGAVDGMKDSFYQMADVTGLIYRNSLLEARLMRYPAFLGLAERDEFQTLANDKQFAEMRQRQLPIGEILEYPAAQAILKNPASLREIWATATPHLTDLRTFLETGKTETFADLKIVGRWYFNVNLSFLQLRQTRKNIPSREMAKWKAWMASAFGNTTVVAMLDKKVAIKNLPSLQLTGAAAFSTDTQVLRGQWQDLGNRYLITATSGGGEETFSAVVDGDRMTMTSRGFTMVFDREY